MSNLTLTKLFDYPAHYFQSVRPAFLPKINGGFKIAYVGEGLAALSLLRGYAPEAAGSVLKPVVNFAARVLPNFISGASPKAVLATVVLAAIATKFFSVLINHKPSTELPASLNKAAPKVEDAPAPKVEDGSDAPAPAV